MSIAKRCIVTGNVQGVWYRAAARHEAERLGVTGYARNLADGSVEVLACGEAAAVAALVDWLWRGPPQAKVAGVAVEDAAIAPPVSFETR